MKNTKLPQTVPLKRGVTYPILFTRGRVDRQKTITYLSKKILKDLIVVTSASEKEDLVASLEKKYSVMPKAVISFPDSFRLVKKRCLTVKWLETCGVSHFIFLDDDLSLTVLDENLRYRTTRSASGSELFLESWRDLDKLWGTYKGIGAAASSRVNYNFVVPERLHKGLYVQDNARSGGFLGYEVESFLSSLDFVYKNDLLQNIAYLDLLSNGVIIAQGQKICRVYNIAWSTNFDQEVTSGGMNLYRNPRNNGVAFLILLLTLPGCFSRKPGTEQVFVNMMKIHRQFSKSVFDWKTSNIDPEAWLRGVTQELNLLGYSSSKDARLDFTSKKAFDYITYLLKKLRFWVMAAPFIVNESNLERLVFGVNLALEEGRCFKIELDPSLPKIIKPAFEDYILKVYRVFLRKWRELPGESYEDYGIGKHGATLVKQFAKPPKKTLFT
jgi:hypothetical protein